MKNHIYLIVFVLLLFSCSEEELSANDATKKLLVSRPWQIQSVKIDGVSSSLYQGLKVTFTAQGYTANNGGKLWPSTGSWSFSDETGKSVERSDGLAITIDAISKSSLTISFNWTETIFDKGGRSSALAGKHELIFSAAN